MKKSIILLLASFMSICLIVPAFAGTGNGLPSGTHYTLNILGKNWDNGDYAETLLNPVVKDNDNGHRMFVKLDGKTRILLVEDTVSPYEFSVIDADGTDGKASFMLPAPGNVIDTSDDQYNPDAATYKIFVRVLSPSGSATITTGAYTDLAGNLWIMSYETVTLDQTMRPPAKFTDVTKQLTTLWIDTDADGIPDTRVKIFDPRFEGYFWDYDNDGLKHVQLRFYPTALFPS